ncbi:hypothetical protein [Photobacterium sp. TY1-4]|uniref:hypothetical protein n=1 Tax=Photobacterium sp. TY1-4 TaxID=2899122 RepID=UPI0021BE3DA1|nr:hypothetical protein [Photobacterium sp. TY1-4]UXI03868.1 hypothetical protein NH461_17240 [Photobacterium sp. TY1-4]
MKTSWWRYGFIGFAFLAGCSEEDLETSNFGSDYYKNQYTLMNATDYEIDFHMANTELDGDERDVENSKYLKYTLAAGAAPVEITHEHNIERQITFYAAARNQLGLLGREKFKVTNDRDYHFLAWQHQGQIDVSIYEQAKDDRGGEFAVRIFAADPVNLTIEGSPVALTTGTMSGRYFVDQCNGGIQMNGQPISICDASFGRSYLLVVDTDGRQALYLEY